MGEELARFNELVLQLELADGGRPLHGSGRDDCARAFQTYPAGFAAAIDEAHNANVNRRCGLLVRLARDGWIARAEQLATARQQEGATDGNRFAAYDA